MVEAGAGVLPALEFELLVPPPPLLPLLPLLPTPETPVVAALVVVVPVDGVVTAATAAVVAVVARCCGVNGLRPFPTRFELPCAGLHRDRGQRRARGVGQRARAG